MEVVADIAEDIERLRQVATVDVSDTDLVGALSELHRLSSMLQAQQARLVDAVDRRGLWRQDGSKALWSWLCRVTDAAPNPTKRLCHLMRGLRVASLTRAEFEAGGIDVERARELASRAISKRKRIVRRFPEAEPTLLQHAKELSFLDFVRVLARWEAVIDEDGEEQQAQDDYESRNLYASNMLRGMIRIDADLDPIGGAAFLTQLRVIEEELFQTDWATAKQVHGTNTGPEHLSRTRAQRRADALVEMAYRAATAPPDGKRPRPLVVVHVGEGTIARMCELASGTVIAPGLVVPHLGLADIQRIIHGPKSKIIDLSETDRFFRGGLREAVKHRDRYCQHPTCDEEAANCDIDHVLPRSHGGLTTQDNARTLCDTHNWWYWNNQQRHQHPNDDPDPPPHDD